MSTVTVLAGLIVFSAYGLVATVFAALSLAELASKGRMAPFPVVRALTASLLWPATLVVVFALAQRDTRRAARLTYTTRPAGQV